MSDSSQLEAKINEKIRKIHGDRIAAAIEALREIFSRSIASRAEAVKVLEKAYRSKAATPLRGKAWPEDIWDKEMATLYTLAKYVLGLDSSNPDIFHSVFSVEEALEDAAIAVLSEEDAEAARRYLGFFLGGKLDDNTIARMLRVIATQVILGLRREEDMEKVLKKLPQIAPELEAIARKYARYYVALRVAQEIALGEIRDRISKEAYKQALAAKIGLPKILPDDEYVAAIAQKVYRIPEEDLKPLLSFKQTERGETSAGGETPAKPKRKKAKAAKNRRQKARRKTRAKRRKK